MKNREESLNLRFMEFYDLVVNGLGLAIDLFLKLDQHLVYWSMNLGPWLYLLLFAIVFCETGLVVTPFLPGDSLLFATGALISLDGSGLNLYWMLGLLILAAILGDFVNYSVGHYLGSRILRHPDRYWIKADHLRRSQDFYERHGGKTIILARFIPIVRTYAPFVAGASQMTYRHFASFNIVGAVVWVGSLLFLGYFFGQTPFVKSQFHWVVVAIIVISFLPVVFEYIRARLMRNH